MRAAARPSPVIAITLHARPRAGVHARRSRSTEPSDAETSGRELPHRSRMRFMRSPCGRTPTFVLREGAHCGAREATLEMGALSAGERPRERNATHGCAPLSPLARASSRPDRTLGARVPRAVTPHRLSRQRDGRGLRVHHLRGFSDADCLGESHDRLDELLEGFQAESTAHGRGLPAPGMARPRLEALM